MEKFYAATVARKNPPRPALSGRLFHLLLPVRATSSLPALPTRLIGKAVRALLGCNLNFGILAANGKTAGVDCRALLQCWNDVPGKTHFRRTARIWRPRGVGSGTPRHCPANELPPTRRQTRAAIAVVLIVIVAFAVVAPFSGRQAATLNAFFPSLDAIVLVTDLITAVLLYAQFSISRSRSLLVLASGYLFTAFIVIPHALTFSGAFSPTGLFGAGLQTGSWLFIFWHIGFAASLLGYAISKDMKRGRLAAETAVVREISWSVVTVVALVSGIAWLTTGGEALLPPIILDTSRLSPFVIYPIWFTILITAAGLVILVFRRRSVLDLWLIVVAAVFIGELAFSGLLPTVRFSVGFYAGRVFSLVTSSIVLIILLAETTLLYVHLARSNDLLQRERHNKLMSMEAMAASIATR